jgi:hypothetical protein
MIDEPSVFEEVRRGMIELSRAHSPFSTVNAESRIDQAASPRPMLGSGCRTDVHVAVWGGLPHFCGDERLALNLTN